MRVVRVVRSRLLLQEAGHVPRLKHPPFHGFCVFSIPNVPRIRHSAGQTDQLGGHGGPPVRRQARLDVRDLRGGNTWGRVGDGIAAVAGGVASGWNNAHYGPGVFCDLAVLAAALSGSVLAQSRASAKKRNHAGENPAGGRGWRRGARLRGAETVISGLYGWRATMPDKKDEEAHRPLVCPTCARPFEDEHDVANDDFGIDDDDFYETDGHGGRWVKLGGLVLE